MGKNANLTVFGSLAFASWELPRLNCIAKAPPKSYTAKIVALPKMGLDTPYHIHTYLSVPKFHPTPGLPSLNATHSPSKTLTLHPHPPAAPLFRFSLATFSVHSYIHASSPTISCPSPPPLLSRHNILQLHYPSCIPSLRTPLPFPVFLDFQ